MTTAAGVWDGADRPAGLEERLGSPLLRLLLAGREVIFVVCRSHEEIVVVLERRVDQSQMPKACSDGGHKRQVNHASDKNTAPASQSPVCSIKFEARHLPHARPLSQSCMVVTADDLDLHTVAANHTGGAPLDRAHTILLMCLANEKRPR